MEVRIPKKILVDGLAVLERVIPSRSSNPILTFLSIEVNAQGIVLRGTNNEVAIEVTLPAETVHQGSFLVPASTFVQVVRTLPGELVELVLADRLKVSSGKFNTQLSIGSAEGYPELSFGDAKGQRIAAADLALGFSRVRYAASTEEYRGNFRGVQLEMGQHMRFVASDGYRLCCYTLPYASEEDKVLIPARSVDEITRVLKDIEGEVEFAIGQGSLTLVNPAIRMGVKLMEGVLPDYNRAIPQNFVLEATLEVGALRESLKRVALLADKTNHKVNLVFQGDTLTINAEGDVGRGSDELKIETTGEAQLMVSFNATFLTDVLSGIEGKVKLKFSGPTTPAMVENPKDANSLAVVVPLRM